MRNRSPRGMAARMFIPLLALSGGCHTFEVHQFDHAQTDRGVKLDRAAVMMATYRTLEGDQTRQPNKLFTEQLIVSLQQRGIDVAERQKVEALLVDSDMVESGQVDLTETERAKRLGRLLKVDVLVYGDAIINETNFTYFSKLIFNNNAERWQLQKEANESGVVRQKGYPVLAQHSIGLSIRAVDTATGEIVWVGYHSLASARWAKEDDPQTLTNFSVIGDVCDAMMDDLVALRR